jgi:hypothetical protein
VPSGPVLTGGASGAHLRHGVVKYGPGAVGARVGQQGTWLRAHQDIPSLPRVAVTWPRGYVMEPLEPVDWHRIDWHAHLAQCVALLGAFWAKPAEHPVDLDAHLRFVHARAEGLPGVWPDLEAWALSLDWPDPVLIHGDPTFCNQVRRQTDLVVLDPNPGSAVTPSVRAQDLAHLAQSLHGYETIKLGAPQPQVTVADLRGIAGCDEGEWSLVRYLTAVKFVRLLAYEPAGSPFASLARRLVRAR